MYKRGQYVQRTKVTSNAGNDAANTVRPHCESDLFAGTVARKNATQVGQVSSINATQLVGAMDAPVGYPKEGNRKAQFDALMQHIRAVYAQYGR